MQREQCPESDTWTDEEIIRAAESAPYLEGSDDKLVQISEDTVMKLGRDWTLPLLKRSPWSSSGSKPELPSHARDAPYVIITQKETV